MSSSRPIALFDSGVGGLSVLRRVRLQLPREHLLYFADQKHIPYGSRPTAEVEGFSEQITRFLLARGAKLVVVACNTATAMAINHLRQTFPEIPFVGIEPALKPAASQTKTGVIGVLATLGTIHSPRYLSLMEQFARGVRLVEDPCLGLVERIEQGEVGSPGTAVLLRQILEPMRAAQADTFILGCTHYPFVRPLIEQILATPPENSAVAGSPPLNIIDPAEAVARQIERLLSKHDLHCTSHTAGHIHGFTTAEPAALQQLIPQLLDFHFPVEAARF